MPRGRDAEGEGEGEGRGRGVVNGNGNGWGGVGARNRDGTHRLEDVEEDGEEDKEREGIVAFNSLVTVSPAGEILAHYRKTHLYYTDETWAKESLEGFTSCELPLSLPVPHTLHHHASNGDTLSPPPSSPSMTTTATKTGTITNTNATTAPPPEQPEQLQEPPSTTKVAFGICMDLNPHHFQIPPPPPLENHPHPHLQPYEAEFAFTTAALAQNARMIVVSMAWLTSLADEQMSRWPREIDAATFGYWLGRLGGLAGGLRVEGREEGKRDSEMESRDQIGGDIEAGMNGGMEAERDVEANGEVNTNPPPPPQGDTGKEILVVFANRTGHEPGGRDHLGREGVRYAGSSWVGWVGGRGVRVLGWLGRGEEGVLGVDVDGDGDVDEMGGLWIPLVGKGGEEEEEDSEVGEEAEEEDSEDGEEAEEEAG